ncbi:MAG: hypothetical protein ACLFWL_18370, partial [Candidatus Brocadiia bacterium]
RGWENPSPLPASATPAPQAYRQLEFRTRLISRQISRQTAIPHAVDADETSAFPGNVLHRIRTAHLHFGGSGVKIGVLGSHTVLSAAESTFLG